MKYAMLIYVSEELVGSMSDEERGAYFAGYAQFHQESIESGMRQGGEPLQPTATSTTVRVRDAETMITDGPFAETKEQLAGFYIMECKDIDEAIAVASKMPDAKLGAIEIRPVFEKVMN